jgi:hypothetical protein
LDHERLLVGLSEDTEYYYRVVSWDGADAGTSDIGTFSTGQLPGWLPSFDSEGDEHDTFTLVPISGEAKGVVAFDGEGNIAWYHRDDRDFEISRALLSGDGVSVVYNAFSADEALAEDSELVRVALDGSDSTAIPVPLLAADFVELPDGTLAALVVDKGDPDDPTQWGNQIVEIDEDGDVSPVWSTFDCFDPANDPGDDPSAWTGANALDFDDGDADDDDDDAYYVGLSNLSSIVRVNRATGECESVFVGGASTAEFEDGTTLFQHQDQFQFRSGSVFVFDTEGGGDDNARVVQYSFDSEADLWSETASFSAETPPTGSSPGDLTRVSGGTFISWGAAGLMQRLDSGDESVWTLDTGGDVAFGYHTLVDSFYPED